MEREGTFFKVFDIVKSQDCHENIGLIDLLANHAGFEALKAALEIGPDSTLLCFNTEGATDPVNYREIIWHGKYPSIV